MRLPHQLLESPYFIFSSVEEVLKAVAGGVPDEEVEAIQRVAERGLPPVTSRMVLATMLGINPGLVWSFESRPHRHYRSFSIPKGRGSRRIDAPRVALKAVQKWLSVQLERCFVPPNHVYGFVPGRSHIDAARQHCGAEWVLSFDITNFFQSTPRQLVATSLVEMGFPDQGAALLARLACLGDFLAQGAPSSPVLSNICFRGTDSALAELADSFDVRLTRYADDIVFSGTSTFPQPLLAAASALFQEGPWRLSSAKTHLAVSPHRLKVHGLLVHGPNVRLTKGYRNRLRAYRHLLQKGSIRENDRPKILGHLNYGNQVEPV